MILSLDLSFSATGYVIFEDNKVVTTGVIKVPSKMHEKKQHNFNLRTGYLAENIKLLFDQYPISEVYFEDLISSKSANALKVLTACKTIVITLCTIKAVKYKQVLPKTMKKCITNDANATKDQIIDEINRLYPSALNPKDPKYKQEAIADSIGIYVAIQYS